VLLFINAMHNFGGLRCSNKTVLFEVIHTEVVEPDVEMP